MGRSIYIYLLIFSLVSISVIGAEKVCPDDPFAKLFAAIQAVETPTVVSPNTYQWLPKSVARKLAQKHFAWLHDLKKNFKAKVPGAVAQLGHGSEGNVYLMQTAAGKLEVFKKFHSTTPQTQVRESMNALKKLKRAGVAAPKVFAVDVKQKTAHFEYVEGFVVDSLITRRENFDLTEEEAELIASKFHEFVITSRQLSEASNYEEYNVVLEFSTGRFVVIDAN